MYTEMDKRQSECSASCSQPHCFRLQPQINIIGVHLYLCVNRSLSPPPGRLLEAHDKHLLTDLEEQKLCS